ncbi:MAG: 16S rRNA (cytosine(1402)-N(4))-methyltransferase [Flavobacteriaceae bacterium]|nr:16S rRNA (cytosine(1402)-N(4))-methyltransferase [Flavobacteriaceae bacterium]
MFHKPVMLKEAIESLKIKQNGIYVDLTYGGGGHSKEILRSLGKNGKLFAFDQDSDASKNKIHDKRLFFINQNFRYLKQNLKYHNCDFVDGILGDLGVSSHQLDTPVRGFATRFDSNLDMRMNQNIKFKAEDVLNNYSEEKLSDIFFKYSNLKNSRKIAKTIIDNRKKSRISTTKELNSILKSISVKRFENKFLAKVYQALRIEVNNEIDSLKQVLYELPNVLNKNGRVVFITYHSVEDRLVKRFFKNGSFEKEPEKDCFGNTNLKFKIDFKFKSPSEEEIKSNHRSRSAKLRAAIKL